MAKKKTRQFAFTPSAPVTLAGQYKPAARPVLTSKRRAEIANVVATLFEGWEETPFEREASARHGLRQAFCLDGHGWRASDREAAALVEKVLARIGIERPTWAQGQPEYAAGRDYCAHCFGPLDDEARSRRARFCGSGCARIALAERDSRQEKLDGGVISSARALLKRETLPARPCAWCAKPFQSLRDDAGCCSPSCSARLREERKGRSLRTRACEACGGLFDPKRGSDRFCTISCSTAFSAAKERKSLAGVTLLCECCGETYAPTKSRQKFCSKRCTTRMAARAYEARKREARKPRLVSSRSEIAPQTFDNLLLLRGGCRITDLPIAA